MNTEFMGSEGYAKMLDAQIATLQQWRIRHTGPPRVKADAKVIYLCKNAMGWLEKGGDKEWNTKKMGG